MLHAEPYTTCTVCAARAKGFCGAIPLRDLDSLDRSRRLVRFDRRRTIVSEGAPALSFFSIVSGVVKLYRSLPDGRTQIIGFRFPGDFFAISDTETYTTTAEALTVVEACRFSKSRLTRIMQSFPQAQSKILEMCYRYLSESEHHIILLGRKTAKEKVASFLLQYGEQFGREAIQKNHHICMPMTRGEIADFLGLTTETVSRNLTSLARDNAITIGLPHSIRLLNLDLLRHISGN